MSVCGVSRPPSHPCRGMVFFFFFFLVSPLSLCTASQSIASSATCWIAPVGLRWAIIQFLRLRFYTYVCLCVCFEQKREQQQRHRDTRRGLCQVMSSEQKQKNKKEAKRSAGKGNAHLALDSPRARPYHSSRANGRPLTSIFFLFPVIVFTSTIIVSSATSIRRQRHLQPRHRLGQIPRLPLIRLRVSCTNGSWSFGIAGVQQATRSGTLARMRQHLWR